MKGVPISWLSLYLSLSLSLLLSAGGVVYPLSTVAFVRPVYIKHRCDTIIRSVLSGNIAYYIASTAQEY